MPDFVELPALSIRQPWAWLIVHGHKDIENRTWATKVRGPILIHASSTMTRRDYAFAVQFADHARDCRVPEFDELQRGGIVGTADLLDSVQHSGSPWFTGPIGLVLRKARPLSFKPCRGRLGFFKQRYPEALFNG